MTAQKSKFGSIFGGKKDEQEEKSFAPSKSSAANEVESPASAAGSVDPNNLLAKGVRVALTKDVTTTSSSTKEGTGTQHGILSLDGSSLKLAITKPSKSWMTVRVSSIRDVGFDNDTCRISLNDDAGGSVLSLVCTDDAGSLSSLQVTDLVARAIKDLTMKEKHADGRASTYDQLLAPLGLTEAYCAAFYASGIPFQNLSVVTRDDLAELVGVTDRLDQINIMTQIKRQRPNLGPPVTKVLPNQDVLTEGVRVVLETDGGNKKKKGRKEMGKLVLDGTSLTFDITQPKKRVLTVTISSVRSAEQEDNACKVWLNEEGGNSSLSFACSDPGGVALSIEQALSGQVAAGSDTSSFAVLLGGLGLDDKYCAAFEASRVPFENLGDMTREDLAELLELVGVTDRLDQINIKAQIKRSFPDLDRLDLDRLLYLCNNKRESDNNFAEGLEAAGKAMEGIGGILEAFV